MKRGGSCGQEGSGRLGYEVRETQREEVEGGGVGVVVEGRKLAGGHLGVEAREIKGGGIWSALRIDLTRNFPPPHSTTICEPSTEWINSMNPRIPSRLATTQVGRVSTTSQARLEVP